ncbi:nicotinate mononucleotide-dependent phosphoribosyltransferase CobT [Anthocerotibacter panamensis]|uniref:nicotinate mononucleotide-dependent phosphoribosyltransferase CobT n=1 Tax=Anthocerotibacter panamensis TaxID=2857077 RepID=UPI001C4088CA|nr:TIGR00303 family protein [Anthocerotibacter panamensis]
MLKSPLIEIAPSVLSVHRRAEGAGFLARIRLLSPAFVLTVAYTATVQLTGLSAAGVTPELREYTAAADAEILEHGRAKGLPGGVPAHPSGIPGPVIITRAAFDSLPGLPYSCVDAGLNTAPVLNKLIRLEGCTSAQAITTGHALTEQQAERLFAAGKVLGERLGRQYQASGRYLILAESVPGGTTTALGLLLALGLDAEGRVSSSIPGGAHPLKLAAVLAGLHAAGAQKGFFAKRPLAGVAAVGDPMQPAVAGIAMACSQYCPVLLGGGTQMAAVVALISALGQPGDLALATTRWVCADPTADLAGLAGLIEERLGVLPVPYLAADLDFSRSRHPLLRQYEAGYVKEGVGAGAAALAACIAHQWTAADLLPGIEQVYERLVLRQA